MAASTGLRITDDGPGVPERVRERLFQPFAGSATPGGAGLGLAIARELARAHGGDLVLERIGTRGDGARAHPGGGRELGMRTFWISAR